MMNEIGIFYIATGVYKLFFQNFLDSLKNLFKGYNKQLIVISDGLEEYDHKKYGETLITVENFINYPYPFINTNKFQIVDHYAKKYNIENILYFDCETIINEYNDDIDNFLLNKINEGKFVSMYSEYFQKSDIQNFMWGTDFISFYGKYNNGFNDFDLMNRNVLLNKDYKWIQTSFFFTKYDLLHYFAEKIKSLVNYNRILNMKLNFTDETWFNYLNCYYDGNKVYGDYFNDIIDKNGINKDLDLSHVFFKYKYSIPKEKTFIKFGTNNKFEVFILYNEDSMEFIEKVNKFFIKNFNNIKISGYGTPVYEPDFHFDHYKYYTPIFYRFINVFDYWFENNNVDIIKEKKFYYDLININKQVYIENAAININDLPDVYGFVNHINDSSLNFDYNEFYNGEYDYIEGKSFNDLNNVNDVDFVIFSTKYINAYFNNDINFIPKIYKLK